MMIWMLIRKNRIRVLIQLITIHDISDVASVIESLGGIVESVGKYSAFITCKIHPKKLRSLISLESITSIDPSIKGHTRNIF